MEQFTLKQIQDAADTLLNDAGRSFSSKDIADMTDLEFAALVNIPFALMRACAIVVPKDSPCNKYYKRLIS